ncbi:MAG: GAF domain-containing SpoIIE family protein phosphatase [Planctomycetota bacterium]
MHKAPVVNPSPVATSPALSITDFLTDGSLAALCAELSQLTGVSVQLRDALGRQVSPGGQGKESWSVSGDAGAEPPPGAHAFPLRVGGERIGAILVGPGGPSLGENPRLSLERAIELLSQASAELCEHELELRHKVKELSALFKLGSMLAHASGMQRVLEVALESALDVLGLDAGSIMLLKEDADGITATNEEDLTVATSRNLSREWLEWPQSLSKGRLFDRLALGGEIVVSEDLPSDPRVQIQERVQIEGLVSAIHAGMIFQSRPLGVMRLYAHDRRSFSESDRRLLGLIANQAAVAIEQTRLLRLHEEEQRIGRQLQLAADVQRRMLPSRVPQIKPLDIAARYIPSFELGGDFYDFIDLNGHLGIVVGDVVGKGIAAALLMSSVRASLRAHAQEVYDLDTVVGKVNQALCRDTLDSEFATLWYGVLNPATLRLTYCNAGHEPPIIVRVPKHRSPSPADIDELSVGGMVVGVDRSQRYQRAVYDLHPGDVFIAYTDGVTDASNFENAKFGKKRLRKTILDVLKAEPDAPAARVLDLIHWEVRRFTGLAPRADDETLVVMRINAGGK